jgi:hypothetical protein
MQEQMIKAMKGGNKDAGSSDSSASVADDALDSVEGMTAGVDQNAVSSFTAFS